MPLLLHTDCVNTLLLIATHPEDLAMKLPYNFFFCGVLFIAKFCGKVQLNTKLNCKKYLIDIELKKFPLLGPSFR
jgi:hypothetical protein